MFARIWKGYPFRITFKSRRVENEGDRQIHLVGEALYGGSGVHDLFVLAMMMRIAFTDRSIWSPPNQARPIKPMRPLAINLQGQICVSVLLKQMN